MLIVGQARKSLNILMTSGDFEVIRPAGNKDNVVQYWTFVASSANKVEQVLCTVSETTVGSFHCAYRCEEATALYSLKEQISAEIKKVSLFFRRKVCSELGGDKSP